METEFVNIIEKISVYEIVNNIIPGAIYVVVVEKLTGLQVLANNNLLTSIVLVYFAGLVISRIGSLIVEPLLKAKLWRINKSFLNLAPYSDFVKAEETGRVRVRYLHTVSNMYRCLTATTLCLLFTVIGCIYWTNIKAFGISTNTIKIFVCILLCLLFAFSYRKQTNYVSKRVDYVVKTEKEHKE